MDIEELVSEEYVQFDPETRVSKLAGVFEDEDIKGVLVYGDEFEGVITRRQLAGSHHHPNEKIGSLVWHVPRLAPTDDVRHVAQLMIDTDAHVLPVFRGQNLIGVVTVDGILEAVQEFLSAATVGDAASTDLVAVDPDSTFGEALHLLRENRISHLPVVERNTAVGILSLYDVTDFTVRPSEQSQGGDPGNGEGSYGAGQAGRGGFGSREGELNRLLDLPVQDLMSSPVRTITRERTLDTAVEEMFAIQGSSLVVTENDRPTGILTKTDILDALTWEAEGNRAVQVYGIDMVDDVSYDHIVAMVDKFDDLDHGMDVLDAKVHLHKHKEQRRGVPLLLARIRLHTDGGFYIASGEGYGAQHALNEARDAIERQIRDEKTRGRSKKPRSEEFWEKRFGWMLQGEE